MCDRVAGRYESWFLQRPRRRARPPAAGALDPPHAHRAARRRESGALWCTVFDPGRRARPRSSSRCRLPGRRAPAATASAARRARAGGMAEWDLAARRRRPAAAASAPAPRCTGAGAAHQARGARARTAIVAGRLDVRRHARSRSSAGAATVGHNWGAEHAERWVWLHAAGFEDEPDAWLELAIARVRVGRCVTPVGGERRAVARRAAATGSAARAAPRSTPARASALPVSADRA